MAATIEAIMLGIEARLATIEGLRVTEFTPDSVIPPAAFVGVPPIPEYRSTFGRGIYTLQPTVTVVTSTALDRVGQMKLAGYANPTGSTSIAVAIEGDRTLGGTVQECWVTAFRPTRLETVGGLQYYGGVFELTVKAGGV